MNLPTVYKAITMVGSRETPLSICDLMTRLSFYLVTQGWVIRTGDAIRADDAACQGVYQFWDKYGYEPYFLECYVAEGSKLLRNDPRPHVLVRNEQPHAELAMRLAGAIHPAWHNCSDFAKKLHGRNPMQVLGRTMAVPSKVLICWAEPKGKSINGGTRTAWEVAKHNNIRCINLYHEENQQRVLDAIEGKSTLSIAPNKWMMSPLMAQTVYDYLKDFPLNEGEPNLWLL